MSILKDVTVSGDGRGLVWSHLILEKNDVLLGCNIENLTIISHGSVLLRNCYIAGKQPQGYVVWRGEPVDVILHACRLTSCSIPPSVYCLDCNGVEGGKEYHCGVKLP